MALSFLDAFLTAILSTMAYLTHPLGIAILILATALGVIALLRRLL